MGICFPTCSAVTAMMSFEFYILNSLLPPRTSARTWFIYRSLDRSVIRSTTTMLNIASRKRSRQTEEEWYWKNFCLTVSCFAHNYVCLTAKFACFKSTFLGVKSKMFTFCRDNLFDLLMIIFSVEFVVLCFQVRCFFLRVCVVFAAFTCLKSALGA